MFEISVHYLCCVAMQRAKLRLRIYLGLRSPRPMNAGRAVKVKRTVSKAKEPSTSICRRLSGISGGRAIYTPFPAENYGAVTRRKARGIEGAAQKYNGHLRPKYPHNSSPWALISSILEEFAMKCIHTHTQHSPPPPPRDPLRHAHSY